MGEQLRSDSRICRRIVRSFLNFLGSVEFAPGTDSEALEVARDCLEAVFGLGPWILDEGAPPGLLLDLFSSWDAGEQRNLRLNLGSDAIQNKPSSSTSTSRHLEDAQSLGALSNKGLAEDSHDLGASRDELFGRFYAALDKVNFFRSSSDGVEDPAEIEKATQLFNEALEELQGSHGETVSLGGLAEFFKSKGNAYMQLKQYSKAIELYTCAIALCNKNAIYYCNRAAAYTHMQSYTEAIEDCLKSIEIDPTYSKAYSRLGSAYFAQGNYQDALCKGYLKACELDPSNKTIQENIEVSKKKLMEQCVRAEEQRTGTQPDQESVPQSAGSTNGGTSFPSFPAGASPSPDLVANIIRGMTSGLGQQSAVPIELANILSGVTSNRGQESAQSTNSTNHAPPFANFPINASASEFANILGSMASSGGNQRGFSEPGVRVDGNIQVDVGDNPVQVSDVLRSVMQMLRTDPQNGTSPGS